MREAKLQNVNEVPEEAGTRPGYGRADGRTPGNLLWQAGSVCVPSSADRLSLTLKVSRLVELPKSARESRLAPSDGVSSGGRHERLRSSDPDAHRSERSERGSPAAQRSEQPGPTEARRGGRGAVYMFHLRESTPRSAESGGNRRLGGGFR